MIWREKIGNQFGERLTVALLERRAHALAVVGEHDEVVWPRRLSRHPLQTGEDRIDGAENREHVRSVNAGMVGDLIVGEKGRVDGRYASEHIRDQHEQAGFLHECRRAGSDERVLEMPLDTREFVAPQLGPSLSPFPNDVADEERQRATEGVGTGEIRHVRTREDPLFVTDGTVCAKTIRCVAGKDVPATGAAIRE